MARGLSAVAHIERCDASATRRMAPPIDPLSTNGIHTHRHIHTQSHTPAIHTQPQSPSITGGARGSRGGFATDARSDDLGPSAAAIAQSATSSIAPHVRCAACPSQKRCAAPAPPAGAAAPPTPVSPAPLARRAGAQAPRPTPTPPPPLARPVQALVPTAHLASATRKPLRASPSRNSCTSSTCAVCGRRVPV